MPNIKPISDLRNYSEVLHDVAVGAPVFLTKNGYGSMVLMSIQMYDALTNNIEARLDEADSQAAETDIRYSHEEVFESLRAKIKR